MAYDPAMEELFGLPAHSLLIHAPIVLLPIVALATVALAVKPTWRARANWWFVGGVFSIVVMVFVTKESGEAFDEALDGAVDVSRHEELAQTTFILTLLWFVSAAALVGYEFVMRRRPAPETLSAQAASAEPHQVVVYALAAVMSILAILATVWLIRTGHEGADVVWGTTTVFDD